jgi:DNA-binding SARP family transcriptional activator/tetratricopeptide (TPR) repeat protein
MLRVDLLGEMAVEVDGTRLSPPESRRAWALLAWLALNPGMHSRGEVAARFWPEVLDSSARASLRSAVWSLKRALGPEGERYLVATRESIGLENVACDAVEFERLVSAGRLEEAVTFCVGGELLAGFDDEWALEARDEQRGELAEALGRLAAETGEVDWARKRLALDPLSEGAARALMEMLAGAGDRSGALAVYAKLRERFRDELGMTPSAETRELADSIRASGDAVPAAAPGPPLVGRDGELSQLLAAWGEARDGTGGVVCLSGEGGIGKTRLAGELLARAESAGARAAACAALDLGGAAPFGLWAELLRDACRDVPPPPGDAAWPGELARLVPQLSMRFGAAAFPATSSSSPELERARLFEAVVELLEWASFDRPLALLVEDVHVADAASLELLAYASRRIARLPILVIVTRRDVPRRAEVDSLEHALRARGVLRLELPLGPLPAADVGRLVSAVAQLDRGDVERVVAAADGNPLLAVESARALAGGERALPASLRGAVRASFSSLSEHARSLAAFAAVAARELDTEEIDGLGLAGLPRAATEAIDSGLLESREGRIGYRHALLREAVYQELPDPERTWLHESLAAALDDPDSPARAAEVARHLRLARRDGAAVEHLARAARHARSVGALAEAANFIEEALRISPSDPALVLDLAQTCSWQADRPAAEAAFDRAVALIGPSDTEALAHAWLTRGRCMRGALCFPAEARVAYKRTLELVEEANIPAPEMRAEAIAGLAWAEATAGDADAVEPLLRDLHELLGRAVTSDLLAHDAASARAFSLIRRGRYREAYGSSIASGEAAQRAGRPDMAYGAWANGACAAAAAGDFERSLEFADRGLRAAAGYGVLAIEVHLQAARAHILTRMGRLDDARQAAEREHELALEADKPRLIATAEHDLGMVALASGDCERAAMLLGCAIDARAPVSRPLARLARAEALTRLGRLDEAEAELRETVLEPVGPADFPDTLVPRLTRIQGLVAAAKGDRVLAERRLVEAANGWRRLLDRGADGDDYVANLVDLGRPPVQGLVEPARELERVECELTELQAVTT